MSEQHTPGPWVFRPDPNGKPHYWVKRDGGFVICRVSGHGEADARLIAAAPELLAALESLLARSKQVPYQNWLEEDQEVARAALARAKAP